MYKFFETEISIDSHYKCLHQPNFIYSFWLSCEIVL